jgi:uncharacterized protein (DUF1800 family)
MILNNVFFGRKLLSNSNDDSELNNGNIIFNKHIIFGLKCFQTIENISKDFDNKIDLEKDIVWRKKWPLAATRSDWIQYIVDEENPLCEKVALFWNHVVPISVGIWGFAQNLLIDAYRKNAFENYEVLLKEVLATPCAMKFLNADNSTKEMPNQNMPRELLELFTVGVDNFNQNDVIQVSMAFAGRRTGGPDNLELSYPYKMYLDADRVDTRQKTILGKSGFWSGDDAIDILVNSKATYYRIAEKFMRFFVSDNPQRSDILELVENSWSCKRLNIQDLIEYAVHSNWFDGPKYAKSKVKTPVELWIGLQRSLGIKNYSSELHSYVLREMGQNVFFPPNVGGWPWGKGWLQGNLLKNRLFLPLALLDISRKTRSSSSWGLKEKIQYRVLDPHLLSFAYEYNIVFDFDQFRETLKSKNIDINEWLGVKVITKIDTYSDLKRAISHPSFQYI